MLTYSSVDYILKLCIYSTWTTLKQINSQKKKESDFPKISLECTISISLNGWTLKAEVPWNTQLCMMEQSISNSQYRLVYLTDFYLNHTWCKSERWWCVGFISSVNELVILATSILPRMCERAFFYV